MIGTIPFPKLNKKDIKNNLTTSTAGYALDARQGKALDEKIDAIVLSPTSPVSIPAAGQTASYSLSGLTPQHELVSWNFSSRPENAPPTSIVWATSNGSFMLYNTGVTTTDTVRPVFVKRNLINGESAPTPPSPSTPPSP